MTDFENRVKVSLKAWNVTVYSLFTLRVRQYLFIGCDFSVTTRIVRLGIIIGVRLPFQREGTDAKPDRSTDLRNTTIGRLTMPYDIEILLKGCPLFSDDVNSEIFLAVQNFIVKSKRFE